jgi:protoporphyrinogen oxidase
VTTDDPVVVLGGGLAGMGTAWALARGGCRDVTVIERGPELGGLAGTLVEGPRFYPLAYHHILHRDRVLLYVLDAIGARPRIRWRRIRMLFRMSSGSYDLSRPWDFARFPMSVADKARFVRLMLRCFRRSDWTDWNDRSAAELVDAWAGPGVRRAMFEPLTRLKFDLPCHEVSGAWLGARLHFREGSAPLGYIPGTNWTKVLCDGLARELDAHGVRARCGVAVARLDAAGGRVHEVVLSDDTRLPAAVVVSSLPVETYLTLAPHDDTPGLAAIRYSAIVSALFVTSQPVEPDFYWMNLPTLDLNACGVFRLESLNPTIGAPGESCFNFVSHRPGRHDPMLARDDATLLAGYRDDFRRIFGFELEPRWSHLTRIPLYSPVFVRGYRNPPLESAAWTNLYFAGNYRTFPSIASTGTALGSGFEAGEAILRTLGRTSGLLQAVARSGR